MQCALGCNTHLEQVTAFHTGAARLGADETSEVGTVEGDLGTS
jgi:hypothetical protein